MIGVGGYVTVPVLMAARSLGIPTVIHESNALPGVSNRFLNRFATRTAVGLAVANAHLKRPGVLTGTPVRREFFDVAPLSETATTRRLLVFGGSQGSRVINRAMARTAVLLEKSGLEVVHQCGDKDLAVTRARYPRVPRNWNLVPFLPNLHEEMAWADLVLSRAGAMTVAELSAAGRPAILVPFGASASGHQLENARAPDEGGRRGADPRAGADGREPRRDDLGALREARAARPDEPARADARPAQRRPGPRPDGLRGRGVPVRFLRLRRIHFVGAGGVGMSGIAEILLLATPLEITGCDAARSENTARLEKLGARISIGHDPSHVLSADLLVISSAIGESSPEVAAARERGIPVVRRAEMLGELMRLKQGVAVAGTHGKTTTTSLTGLVLTEAGFDPTIVVGGRVHILGTNARLGKGEYLVAEADEYDRSFLELTPVVAVITNVEADHLDTYRDLDDILDAFATFANRVPFFGSVVVCGDDPGVRRLMPRIHRRTVTYGECEDAQVCARRVRLDSTGTLFEVWDSSAGRLGEVRLRLPGRHNVAERARRHRRRAASSSFPSRRSPGRSRRSRGSSAASSARASATGSSSSTTTRTIRRRSARRSPPRGRSTRSGVSSRCSSRICIRGPATSPASSARR